MHLIVMNEPELTPEDEAQYMQVMAGFDAAMRDHFTGPVPMCHFTPMTFHDSDSDSYGSGYQCDHCGHSESPEEAWAKVKARESRKKAG